jgi:diphosphomevalonate decarboxylase
MSNRKAAAVSCPNIAFIKYWGNRDDVLRLPANSSLSMNLAGLETRTTVEYIEGLPEDEVVIGGEAQTGATKVRVTAHLDLIRTRAGITLKARVDSNNNFPAGVGIASSASAFAALSVAGATAAGLALTERELSALARRGSGSAARSIPAGFVQWDDEFAFSIAPPEHWALADVVAVISKAHKAVGSTGGHTLAGTSPLQAARVARAPERLRVCREAVLNRDFAAFAEIVESDSNIMHAVMLTSTPPLYYWEPLTLAVMKAVREWRAEGLPVGFTIDAGPNVHCLCLADSAPEVERRLRALGVAETLTATPGGAAWLVR